MYEFQELKDIREGKVELDSKVVVVGKIISKEIKPYKSGKGELVNFIINDEITNITCVKFFNYNKTNKEEIESFYKSIKLNQLVSLEGKITFDETYNQVSVASVGIKRVNSPIYQIIVDKLVIEDEGKRSEDNFKRVEFGVVTNSSTQQSLVKHNELLELTNRLGYEAVGVADKGVVRAYSLLEKELLSLRNVLRDKAEKEPNEKNKKLYENAKKMKLIVGNEVLVSNGNQGYILNGDISDIAYKDIEFVIFDLETTGFHPIFRYIFDIGAVKVKNGVIIEKLNFFIKPNQPIPNEITKLTKVTNDMVKEGLSEEEGVKRFLEFIGENSVIVGHNVKFDVDFINYKSKVYNLGKNLTNHVILDTIYLTKYVVEELQNKKKLKSYSLDKVLKHFGITIQEHHRAYADSISAFKLLEVLIKEMENNKIENLKIGNEIQKQKLDDRFPTSVLIYAKNREGLQSLYELSTIANVNNSNSKIVTWEDIEKRRKNLIIISNGFETQDIYENILRGKFNINDLHKYDVIGLHSIKQNYTFNDLEEKHLKVLNQIVNKKCEEINKMIISLGSVLCLNQFESKYLEMLWKENERKFHPYIKNKNIQRNNAWYKTVNELVEEFSYLGSERAFEIISKNTIELSNQIEEFDIVPKDRPTASTLEGGEEEKLRELVENNFLKLYGNNAPKEFIERKDYELNKIIEGGYAVIYYASHLLVKKSLSMGYRVGSRGSVGSSFVAFLSEITEVNPIQPHFHCEKCKKVELVNYIVGSGYDLGKKKCECGSELKGKGFNIPFSSFMGIGGNKTPDIDLNFSSEIQSIIHNYMYEIFGTEKVLRVGTTSTLSEGKSKKIIWDYFKSKGELSEHKLINLYTDEYGEADGSNFFELEESSGEYVKKDYIYMDLNNFYIEKLIIKNNEAIVERLCFELDSLIFKEVTKYLNGVAFSSGQHAGGMLVFPKDKDISYYMSLTFSKDGTDKKTITSQQEYKPYEDCLLKFDILGHDDSTRLHYLEILTKVSVDKIDMYDENVIEEFAKGNTQRISEFNTFFSSNVTVLVKPKTFEDLVRISGVTHGTGVWEDNAELLIAEGKEISEVIACREDMFLYLVNKGVEEAKAFEIVEFVRKGKLYEEEKKEENIIKWNKYKEILINCGVEDWYIDSMAKIKYLFPKAHAVAYVENAYRLMWYKLYYPLEFVKVMLDLAVKKNEIDFSLLLLDIVEIDKLIEKFKNGDIYDLSRKVKSSSADLLLIKYVKERGIDFLPINFNKSDSKEFLIEEGKLRIPYSVIPNLTNKQVKKMKEKVLKEDIQSWNLFKEKCLNRIKNQDTIRTCKKMIEFK